MRAVGLERETTSGTSQSLWRRLGPGFVTGAADDDPSGIATYSQAGAALGYGILWTLPLTFPLMVSIQVISARIGRVTGKGLAANIAAHCPRWLLLGIVLLLFVANTVNIAADIAAMGAAVKLMIGGPAALYAVALGLLSLALQIQVGFEKYARVLKFLTLALFAYVVTAFLVKVNWIDVLSHTLIPRFHLDAKSLALIVAVFGTTISPYLFFWQAAQEVEELHVALGDLPLKDAPAQAHRHLRRIKIDTQIGMAFSNLVAFFIMVTAAATLHRHGMSDIQTSAQAAEALRPLAGAAAFLLFALGIVGTGMLAVPVLAAASAYSAAEAFGWQVGLGRTLAKAPGFYSVLGVGMALGLGLNFTALDPIKALIGSAIVNGIVAVPIMAVLVVLSSRREVMGDCVASTRLKTMGWIATAIMAAVVLGMLVTSVI
jgi:NRAMP (natural resistance-associated macrophage protein)-like metal ion transporter